jgi:hypothetical protein
MTDRSALRICIDDGPGAVRPHRQQDVFAKG